MTSFSNLLLLLAAAGFVQGCRVIREISPGQEITLTSPGFPRFYRFGRSCAYQLIAESTSTFNIECQTFNLRPSCRVDYLAIVDGSLFFGFPRVRRFCGSETVNFSVETSIFTASFISRRRFGRNRKYQGFSCTVSIAENTDTTTVSELEESSSESSESETSTSADSESETSTSESSDAEASTPENSESETSTSEESSSESSTSDDSDTETATETDSTTTVETEPSPRCTCGQNALSARIVNGEEADLNEYPWQAMLRYSSNGQHYCGGTLISPKCVLTAAHCVDDLSEEDIIVSLGDHQKSISTETESINRTVDKLIMHENYNSKTVDNDIALLCFDSPVTYTDEISPACLPYDPELLELDGRTGSVTGWGTSSSGGSTTEVLNELDIPLLDTKTCRTYRYRARQITDNMICTYKRGKDSCQGDSGGPLVTEDEGSSYVVGVVSWGNGCGRRGYPGVYAKVTNYLQWIEQNTGETFCQP